MDKKSESFSYSFFFFNDTATTEIYTLSLHDALPISVDTGLRQIQESNEIKLEQMRNVVDEKLQSTLEKRSEEHTSELQSH